MLRFLKDWTLPVAIAVGIGLYLLFALTPALQTAGDTLSPILETLLPITIFFTLFVTFSKVDFHRMRLRRWHLLVLVAQLAFVAVLLFALLSLPADGSLETTTRKHLLEVVLICVIAPCASASPVVVGKLGGDLTQMTTFMLLSSVVASLLIPALFPLIEPHEHATFLTAFLAILSKLAAVLLLPLALGAVVRHRVKPIYDFIKRSPDLGFYLWCVCLAITSGLTMRNILSSHTAGHLFVAIALLPLATAIVQALIGGAIGHNGGERICTRQAMFQKNTGLAIWIAWVFLTPEASIGAGCYVLWQNLINSFELWRHQHSGAQVA